MSEQQLVNFIAQLAEDGLDASIYEGRLAALRASATAPKTPTVANAKRLADNASAKIDKAILKVESLQNQAAEAQHELELAALQLQEANATYDKLLVEEQTKRGLPQPAAPAASCLSIDKIILGEIPVFDLGVAAAYFDQGDPEVARKLADMQSSLASHMQAGFADFVQQHKAQWESAKADIMLVVDENQAKKRKQDEALEPASPERTTLASNTAVSTDIGDYAPAFPPLPAPGANGAPQLPPQQGPTAQVAPISPVQAEVSAQEARAAATEAAAVAKRSQMRADAMASAAVKLAQASVAVLVDGKDGMDCCA